MGGQDSDSNRRSRLESPSISRHCSLSSSRILSNNNPFSNSSPLLNNLNMDYAWLQPRHDPIATDTNLAQIDFENFKNEDLAFAFCEDEESGGSSTDMSICRSEALFSSMRDSIDVNALGSGQGCEQQDSLYQDSLVEADFNYSEQIKVNKNNYTLTYSGNGAISSLISSMVSSAIIAQNNDENGFSPSSLPAGLQSSGKLITWYNLSKPEKCRSRRREENTLNNNYGSGSNESRKSQSLPDLDGGVGDGGGDVTSGETVTSCQVPVTVSEVKLANAFMLRGSKSSPDNGSQMFEEDQAPMVRSKDAVNQYLKNASRLTSIEEASAESYQTSGSGSSGSSGSSRSSSSPTSRASDTQKTRTSTSTSSSSRYPNMDFLENDLSLWDAFFFRNRTSTKFQSVLMKPAATLPPLPVEEYLRDKEERSRLASQSKPTVALPLPLIQDAQSLRFLLPKAHQHLIPQEQPNSKQQLQNQTIKSMFNQPQSNGTRHKVKEAWPDVSESSSGGSGTNNCVLRRRSAGRRSSSSHSSDRNLNALNNNDQDQQNLGDEALAAKRRSYIPQDYLSKVLTRSSPKPADFPKSGSQHDLCADDSWKEEETEDEDSSRVSTLKQSTASRGRGAIRNISAEYPFQKNLCMGYHGINLDLTHKRGLFVSLYNAVERLLMHQDHDSSAGSARLILFHELCPALHAIMSDGLKPEVITSFGRMPTSVWRVVEAVTRQGGPNAGTTICDLVMLLNTKFAANGEDHKKFAGFVAGLINMSTLHVWFTRLKWNMDVLLRFYERHAFICALHKETRLLFDELLFCLQRLYAINCQIDLPFQPDLLEDMALLEMPGGQCGCHSHTCSRSTSSVATNTPTGTRKGSLTPTSGGSVKSRIPRPISLPKRLEAKLASSPSPVRVSKKSSSNNPPDLKSPMRTVASGTPRKSRVRDTIRLFDAKSGSSEVKSSGRSKSGGAAARASSSKSGQLKSPKTGAGEAMALESSQETK